MENRGPLKNKVGESTDYQRPRRPSEDTLAYIKSLPLDIQASTEEIQLFLSPNETEHKPTNDEDEDRYPQLFAAALGAIDETKLELASLAGDEHGSQCVEIIARITAPYSELAVRKLLWGCSGYFLHLATHRYGSHVLQTILQLSTTTQQRNNKDLALEILEDYGKTDEGELPLLSELILSVVEELAPHASQLAIHMCGSHVLRTLLCVLAGVELLAGPGGGSSSTLDATGNLRRGRQKGKKKKKKKSAEDGLPAHAGLMHMVYLPSSRLRIKVYNNASFQHALEHLTRSLTGGNDSFSGPGELQKLAIHPSAGPLLIILLRVLTYASCSNQTAWQQVFDDPQQQQRTAAAMRHLGLHPAEPAFSMDSSAHELAKRILCWQDQDDSEETTPSSESYVPDIIYGLAGEPRGSHLLETFFRLSPDSFYESLIHLGGFYNKSTLQDYVEDSVSNYVIQTLMNTTRTKAQTETMLKAISPLISNGMVIDPAKQRRGILWRAVEAAAKFRTGQDGVLKAIRLGFAALQADGPGHNDEQPSEQPKKKERRKASAVEFSSCIPKLLNAHVGAEGKVQLDVPGARTVHSLLRFASRLCEESLQAIFHYSPEMLEAFAKDGLASRCIWDGVLDGPTDEKPFSHTVRELRTNLQGRWVALSCDRVGQHVVKKIFRKLSEKEKISLVEELSGGISRLGGNAMGRSVMEACAVRHLNDGIDAWRHAVKNAGKQEDFLNDVFGDGTSKDHGKEPHKRKREKHGSSEKKRKT